MKYRFTLVTVLIIALIMTFTAVFNEANATSAAPTSMSGTWQTYTNANYVADLATADNTVWSGAEWRRGT